MFENKKYIIKTKKEAVPPEDGFDKKNKKGLASVILASNSPKSNW